MKRLLIVPLLLLSWVASAQCTTGATQLLGDGKLYGCVEGQWKKLTEDVPSNVGILGNLGGTQNNNGVVQARENNNVVSQLLNIGNVDEAISDAPPHVVGKVYYSTSRKHFYQGVAGGLWHQIDNMVWSSTQTRSYQKTFYSQNCASNYAPNAYTVNHPETITRTSTISQADADNSAGTDAYNAAVAWVNTNGQSQANQYGSCYPTGFTSTKCAVTSGTVYRNNCPSGYTGGFVYYSTGDICSTYTSSYSQADADAVAQSQANASAQNSWNANAQTYANINGQCYPIVYTCNEANLNKVLLITYDADSLGGTKGYFKCLYYDNPLAYGIIGAGYAWNNIWDDIHNTWLDPSWQSRGKPTYPQDQVFVGKTIEINVLSTSNHPSYVDWRPAKTVAPQ